MINKLKKQIEEFPKYINEVRKKSCRVASIKAFGDHANGCYYTDMDEVLNFIDAINRQHLKWAEELQESLKEDLLKSFHYRFKNYTNNSTTLNRVEKDVKNLINKQFEGETK